MQNGNTTDTLKYPITIQTLVQAEKCTIPTRESAANPDRRPPHAKADDLRFILTPKLRERLAAATPYLPHAERVLVEQFYLQGWPAARIAALSGEPVRKVRRHARQIAERALTDEFKRVAADGDRWDPQMRAVGSAVFIRGLSALAASRALGIPYRAALLHARTIREIAKAAPNTRKRGAA